MIDDLLYIQHILTCVEKIQRHTRAGPEAFLSDDMVQDAVVRNLQVLAESSKRVSHAAQSLAPDVPWRSMAGFRNIAVHDYLGLDLARIWDIVAVDLPVLQERLKDLKDKIARRDPRGTVDPSNF